MFKDFFIKNFRSNKSISHEEAEDIKQEIGRLEDDTKLREAQIIKLQKLVINDPVHETRYNKRIQIHFRIIDDNQNRIEELKMKLLNN
jgi:hypothetical protein